ncbi:MAG: hypothetical protein PF904_15135 [Kiritimatiellae bacterium]|jgi:hypothetical protein|nr:hypothetical protein [Kiritimatiellia bacterium]
MSKKAKCVGCGKSITYEPDEVYDQCCSTCGMRNCFGKRKKQVRGERDWDVERRMRNAGMM